MVSIPCYSRWHREFPAESDVDRVEFAAPDDTKECRPTFRHQPARLVYDHHGYESTELMGEPMRAIRYTPTSVGIHTFRALDAAGQVCDEGQLVCDPSDHCGYVRISDRDSRYFACSDGSAFVPIGPCLVGPPRYRLPRSREHFETSDQTASMGCAEYARWFRLLAENGGNFCRIWLSNAHFEVETEIAGELDLAAFARVDRLIELAREYGIRLKLCLEHWRTFEPGNVFSRAYRHPSTGLPPASVDAWFQEPEWRELWLKKVDAFLARYGGDPAIMAWELWNEINCARTSGWEIQREWTRDMLNEIRRREPSQLVVNSVGSFDDEGFQSRLDDFKMDEMDFQQVHRYLDQGAPWAVCHVDPVRFSLDAIERSRRPDRPILLAETGAVNDRHTGPFRYYRWDERGLIFFDTTYPAFFAGAAGAGNIWHWDQYVDQKDLWPGYRPMAELLKGIQVDGEGFQAVDLSSEDFWCLVLAGHSHLLGLVRHRADRWDHVLRDGHAPHALTGCSVDLSSLGYDHGAVQVIPIWQDDPQAQEAVLERSSLRLPAFRHGFLIRIDRA